MLKIPASGRRWIALSIKGLFVAGMVGQLHADRQALVGTISGGVFTEGTPLNADDGKIVETEFRMSPSLDASGNPVDHSHDRQIVHLRVQSSQSMVIPLGSCWPATWTLRYNLWGNNDGQSGEMNITHFYQDDPDADFNLKGPWVLRREGFAIPDRVKLLAKRGLYSGGWGVTYYLQVQRGTGPGPLEVSVSIETNAEFAEVYGTGAVASARFVPEKSVTNAYTSETAMNGTLLGNGSPILTEASSQAYLSGQGFLTRTTGDGASANPLALAALGDSSNALGEFSLAIGNGALAWSPRSVAIGSYSNASISTVGENIALVGGSSFGGYSFSASYGVARGEMSLAIAAGEANGDGAIAIGGFDWQQFNWPANLADGENSTAFGGIGNEAEAFCSLVGGYWNYANSAHSVVLGSLNLPAVNANPVEWIDTDPLFELGNGWAGRAPFSPSATYRSNAITTLKNGRTTLTNKAWMSAVSADPEQALSDPPSAADSGGEALVVDGHARLRGKVILEQPQGDISMGIYGGE